jgi:hypothetical protein
VIADMHDRRQFCEENVTAGEMAEYSVRDISCLKQLKEDILPKDKFRISVGIRVCKIFARRDVWAWT